MGDDSPKTYPHFLSDGFDGGLQGSGASRVFVFHRFDGLEERGDVGDHDLRRETVQFHSFSVFRVEHAFRSSPRKLKRVNQIIRRKKRNSASTQTNTN
jgi:hypothetical protein